MLANNCRNSSLTTPDNLVDTTEERKVLDTD